MNHTEKSIHTAHKHPSVLVQKMTNFGLQRTTANFLRTICEPHPHLVAQKAILNEMLDKKLAVISIVMEENERLQKRIKELERF